MKSSSYKSYEALPIFLNANMVAQVLGVSISSCYELMLVGISSLHSVSGMRGAAENCISALSFLLFGSDPLRWALSRFAGNDA